jgi:hypothetical protein
MLAAAFLAHLIGWRLWLVLALVPVAVWGMRRP